ncbi:uncharacterized protein E5676_scaffold14G00020 [Cucumis melo var. makuwa]|uniref:Envelope-like protein n=1 Tax=Cucumis melo var. makuwa TaxID=1194695 RepID=A0A5A7VI17_CUCMM|nr:uncharacterized protein E6C27_scaffold38G00370 [Cucumis melo var. makuwa]TYK26240.1 uncharacterized protein E5676_scaffold14G00020 [Cucumis melo var. makuwa]
MVNTRKGNYQARSSKAIGETPTSQTNMHGVRMRGRHFKSTPTRRVYRLPSEKSQVNISESSPLSVHDENIADSAAEGIETAPSVSETHISEMDSDEHDDVPLARLLRKGLLFNVEPLELLLLSLQFILMKAHPLMKFLFQRLNPADVDAHVEPIDTCAPNNVEPQPETQQSLGESRPKGKKYLQIFYLFPLMDFRFILKRVYKDGNTLYNSGLQMREILSSWPVNEIPVVSLSVKYAILHKIDIANWFPFSHASSVSFVLGTFLYQICNDEIVNADMFIYNQLLRHMGTFGVKIPIPLLLFFSSLLIHLNVEILTLVDALGLYSKTLSLSYRFFQESHVPDIEHDMRPSRNHCMFDTNDVDENAEGLFVHRDLAFKIINSLTAEYRALSTSINLLSDKRLEVDLLVRHLKTLIPSSSTGAPDQE